MNALTTLFSTQLPRPRTTTNVVPLQARAVQRERDFGIGYGTSSGYAKAARYVANRPMPAFRFG